MKIKLALITLALLLVTSQTASAAVGTVKSVPPDRNSVKYVSLVEKLNLNNQQAEQMKELNLRTYQSTKPLKIKLMDAKFELRQLGLEKTDKATIDVKVKQIESLRAQIHQIHQDKHQKLENILSTEQLSQLKAMKEKGPCHCKHHQ